MNDARQTARWVLHAQSGDKEAFDQLLRSVQEALYHYALHMVRRPELAQDVLQDTFVLLYRKLRWLREPGLFRPWAFRICTRVAWRALRREQQRSERLREDVVLAELPAAPPKEEVSEELLALVEHVSPASRAVLVLHYLHEMTLEEVADVLDVALGTVKSRLAYGLAVLRKKLRSGEAADPA